MTEGCVMHSRFATRRSQLAYMIVAVLVAGHVVAGHEFWLTVTSTRLVPGQTVPFVIGFGERLQEPTPGVDLRITAAG